MSPEVAQTTTSISVPAPDTARVGSLRVTLSFSPGTSDFWLVAEPSSTSVASISFWRLSCTLPSRILASAWFGFAGEDRVDVVLGVVEFLHVEIDLGAGVAGLGPDFRDAFQFEFGEGLQGAVEVLGDAFGADPAQGGLVADRQFLVGLVLLGAGVDLVGLAQLAALHGDVAVGDLDLRLLGRGERAAGLRRPSRAAT